MHLKAIEDIDVSTPHLSHNISITKGETIHTENSHKFNHQHINELAIASGLELAHIFTDKNKWFSLIQMHKPTTGANV